MLVTLTETLRRSIRGAVGADSALYRSAAALADASSVIAAEGIETWRRLNRIARSRDTAIEGVRLRKLAHPILVRHGSSDVTTVINNCVREEYGQFRRSLDARFIVDAGAYIGDTTAYFLSRFPASVVVALEPNDDSYPLAERNLAPYGRRADLLRAALWDRTGVMRFGGEQTAAALGQGDREVSTVTVAEILNRYARTDIDILKMDIEGAEATVLASGVGQWLSAIRLLLLETHGAHVEAVVLPLLQSNGFHCSRFRNVWYCWNEKI